MASRKITTEREHLMQIKRFQQQFNIIHLKEESHPQCENLKNLQVRENKENNQVNTMKPRKQKVQNKEKVHRFLHRGKHKIQDTYIIKYIIKSSVSSIYI